MKMRIVPSQKMNRFWLVGQHEIDNQQNDLNIEIWTMMKKAIEKF